MSSGHLDRWAGTRVVVTGFGVSGAATAQALQGLGAKVVVLDAREPDQPEMVRRAGRLAGLGVELRFGPDAQTRLPGLPDLPGEPDLVVTSPGWRPDAAVLVEAAHKQIPVYSEVELAWRLRGPGAAPWLCVTGTNGKTTTVQMSEQILTAAGLRTAAVGNVGRPVIEAVLDSEPFDVLAVELSSFQLHWTHSLAAESAAVLNLADDHLDWHGGAEAYAAAKAKVYSGVQRDRIYNADDPVTEQLALAAPAQPGSRMVGFSSGAPEPGMLGVADGVLIDRAHASAPASSTPDVPRSATAATADAARSGVELIRLSDLADDSPHQIANALAAAALTRAHGVGPEAVQRGLSQFRSGPHRGGVVAEAAGICWIDDSKATNPHAALASLLGLDSVVWIAGGLAKGARFDDLVIRGRDRLRAVVLIGTDAPLIAEALHRHAPDVPIELVSAGENEAMDIMDRAVAQAARFARPGDAVLLAPGCASLDQFRNYAVRGELFADAARAHLAKG